MKTWRGRPTFACPRICGRLLSPSLQVVRAFVRENWLKRLDAVRQIMFGVRDRLDCCPSPGAHLLNEPDELFVAKDQAGLVSIKNGHSRPALAVAYPAQRQSSDVRSGP